MTPLASSLLIAGILAAGILVILAVMWLDVARGAQCQIDEDAAAKRREDH